MGPIKKHTPEMRGRARVYHGGRKSLCLPPCGYTTRDQNKKVARSLFPKKACCAPQKNTQTIRRQRRHVCVYNDDIRRLKVRFTSIRVHMFASHYCPIVCNVWANDFLSAHPHHHHTHTHTPTHHPAHTPRGGVSLYYRRTRSGQQYYSTLLD